MAGTFVPLSFVRDTLTPSEKAVMLAVACLVPEDAPRVLEARFIARDAHVSEGSVQKAVRTLEARGYLHVVRRPAEPNTYRLGAAWLGSERIDA